MIALDINSKTFVMHIAIREQEKMMIDFIKKIQIENQSDA